MSFGENLRLLLEQSGMSQKQIAPQLNLSPSTVSNYVQSLREPDFKTLLRIADFFDVSTDFLLDHQSHGQAARQEQQLLTLFREFSPAQRELLLEQAQVLLRYAVYKRMKSQ